MVSTKLTKLPKKKAKLLKADQIPEVILDVIVRHLKITTKLWTLKKIVNNFGQISHCCNRSKLPHRLAI
jgi:hypothetical protein